MSNYGDIEVKTSSIFLRIEAGQPKDLRLLDDEPTEFMKHTIQQEGGAIKSFNCPGPETCEYCQSGKHKPPKQRFMVNVFDHGSQQVMLFEYGAQITKQIKSIALSLKEEQKDVMEVDLKIEATGSNMGKKYSVTPRMTVKEIPSDLKKHVITKDIPF